jgi:hypothetical protein
LFSNYLAELSASDQTALGDWGSSSRLEALGDAAYDDSQMEQEGPIPGDNTYEAKDPDSIFRSFIPP